MELSCNKKQDCPTNLKTCFFYYILHYTTKNSQTLSQPFGQNPVRSCLQTGSERCTPNRRLGLRKTPDFCRTNKGTPLVASLLLVAMPGAPSSFLLLVVRPGAPSSVLDTNSDGLQPKSDPLLSHMWSTPQRGLPQLL